MSEGQKQNHILRIYYTAKAIDGLISLQWHSNMFPFPPQAHGWCPLQWNQLLSTKGPLQPSWSSSVFFEHCSLRSQLHIYNIQINTGMTTRFFTVLQFFMLQWDHKINKPLLTNRPVHFAVLSEFRAVLSLDSGWIVKTCTWPAQERGPNVSAISYAQWCPA